MRKKVDARIRALIEAGVASRKRSLFVIVGDKGRDQVVNLHYMLSKAAVRARPSVLWCYKKDLFLSSHRRKRMGQIKKLAARGLLDPEKEDPFAMFMASTSIRYCYYAETSSVLGNTFGMLVLQDFEALTPNLLARTIETVEGGGIVVLLLATLDSLTQLYTMAMDVHARFRTEAHADVTGRFNERFLLSLAACPACLFMDDELNVLPLSTHAKTPAPTAGPAAAEAAAAAAVAGGAPGSELRSLTDSLSDTPPAGPLLGRCRTLDQARAVLAFIDAASEKTLRSTVALTAGRGRGKSAALGLAIAGALGLGYANVFVTAPSPENLRTLFEFVLKGLDALGYKEHLDYDLVESTNPEWGKCVVRLNVYRAHRQTVQYIAPSDAARCATAELLVIDEAAAIPLPTVKALLGPYLVFLCSTVQGYEGTGRSLSLKLVQQLREQGARLPAPATGGGQAEPAGAGGAAGGRRVLREVVLAEPIRYAPGDGVEAWLNDLLCLHAADEVPKLARRLPHPTECELYWVNRDTLFSRHAASEAFLQRLMALYVASHYRNTPNDLQLLADAPAHQLFVLLGPVDASRNALPDVLCVLQVALEGAVSRASAVGALARGTQPSGDLIPWTVSTQYQDAEFATLSGARIVRVAAHPDVLRSGYGSRAVSLLAQYYSGELAGLGGDGGGEEGEEGGVTREAAAGGGGGGLRSETLRPRSGLPPLLSSLGERRPEVLHWLGAAYGLTQELHNFWAKAGFEAVYLRQTASDLTGECSCVSLRGLAVRDVAGGTAWLRPFAADFRARLAGLLAGPFRAMAPALGLSLLDPQLTHAESVTPADVCRADGAPLSAHDVARLGAYAGQLVDHHLIADLVPPLARAWFGGRLAVTLSHGQAAILLLLGLQSREVGDAAVALGLPTSQLLALFNKAVRKMHAKIKADGERAATAAPPAARAPLFRPPPITASLEDDLAPVAPKAAKAARKAARAAGATVESVGQAEAAAALAASVLRPEGLQQFAIDGRGGDWEGATGGKAVAAGKLVSVKRKGAAAEGGEGGAAAAVAEPAAPKTGGKAKKAKGKQ